VDIKEKTMQNNPVIEVKDLYLSFKDKPVLRGVNFFLNKGECLALIGGSGEGKSTILRSVIGLEYPDSGQILFEGKDIIHLKEDEYTSIRKKISYVFQGGALFDSMTVYDNLAFPLREHTDYSENKIKKMIFSELEEFELKGCESMYPSELSGGMQKRLGIARATITKPNVILYDEPTTGLDPYNIRSMQDTIMKLQKKGTSSMIVTHDMQSALKLSNRVALLGEGKIKTIDTSQGFKKRHSILLDNFINGIRPGE